MTNLWLNDAEVFYIYYIRHKKVAVSHPRFTAIYPKIFEDCAPSMQREFFVLYPDGITAARH